jgi:hypothetical protein
VTTVALQIPRPLEHQIPILNDPCTRKMWRAGRRTGKSVAGRIAAIRGHGPKGADGKRLLKGMLDGANIAWLTKTYKQSKVVWRKLLKSFRPLEGVAVKIDREDKRIETIGGVGAITVWSGHTRDAIDNLRGDAYDGILLDEAAYMDLEYALNDVAEPAMLDNGGWVFVFSSPNAAWDGNEQRVAPSYFNRLCSAILAGKEWLWRQWHNRTEDNPKLDREALQRLRDRLGPDSPTAQQELDGSLIAGGLLALHINRDVVVVPPRSVPRHWTYFGAFDWGYNHPYSFGLFAVSEDGVIHLADSLSDRLKVPVLIGTQVGALLERHGLNFKDLTYTVAGHDCWHDIQARGENTPTVAEQLWLSHGWSMIKASISRITGLNNMRAYLAADRFKVHDTPSNNDALLCLESRITDPKRPEDVLKQDANQDGQGGDDPYDMVRYGLASRPLLPDAPAVGRPQDIHPGINPATGHRLDKGRKVTLSQVLGVQEGQRVIQTRTVSRNAPMRRVGV